MAKQISIPITDHNSTCTLEYIVRYKLTSDPAWTPLQPNPFTTPILIPNLVAAGDYEIEITRVGCNGIKSEPVQISQNT